MEVHSLTRVALLPTMIVQHAPTCCSSRDSVQLLFDYIENLWNPGNFKTKIILKYLHVVHFKFEDHFPNSVPIAFT